MRILIFIVALAVLPAAYADDWAPSHYCRKPHKPFQFSSQWELDSFLEDVRRYKQCITDFIDEQENAIENHRQAAEDALDEWNYFVRLELN